MSNSTISRIDRAIRAAVEVELIWTPELEAEVISVDVKNTVVTLSGVVGDELTLLACGRAMRRVAGVAMVTNTVTVRPDLAAEPSGSLVAENVERALFWESNVPRTVKAHVQGGRVLLSGQVKWDFQRKFALRVAEQTDGVDSVDDQISLTARFPNTDVEKQVMTALHETAQIDASDVIVTVVDGVATLAGWVRSLAEKRQAFLATWDSPEVNHVNNQLRVHTLRTAAMPPAHANVSERDFAV